MSSSSSPTAAYPKNAAGFVVAPQAEVTAVEKVVVVYRWIVIATVMSLIWKASYFPLAYGLYAQLQLVDSFFPSIMRSHELLVLLIGLPVTLGLATIVFSNRILFRVQAIAMALGMAGLCWHQGSYNDVTFLTCFWVSLWMIWFTFSMDQPIEQLLPKARVSAILIVSLMFLGGAVGKLTPGYWSGEVLYQIYFVDRDFWFFNLLRGYLEPSALRSFATGYSRMVIITESACAFLWLLPPRVAGILALVTFSGIVVFSNFNLLSVMCCLLGLCGVAIYRPSDSTRTSL
ncbi:MAG: hypothetical protein AAFN77_07785 [Planctomycetota bacterium]